MSVFKNYSRYYDLLYKDKDYAAEARYVDGLIKQKNPGASSMLEFGCGTGRYTRELAGLGYSVHGVDLSEDMLTEARKTSCDKVMFSQGDMRSLRLGRQFDVVTALFHVLSYQTADDDVLSALFSVREHLCPGGVAVLDFWYGPAVLTLQPTVRFKKVSDSIIEVSRTAVPELHADTNIVDVNYHAFIKDISSGRIDELEECHSMRYFFDNEILRNLESAGLTLYSINAWMDVRKPDLNSWAACVVCGVGL